jgi:hypothetical protein
MSNYSKLEFNCNSCGHEFRKSFNEFLAETKAGAIGNCCPNCNEMGPVIKTDVKCDICKEYLEKKIISIFRTEEKNNIINNGTYYYEGFFSESVFLICCYCIKIIANKIGLTSERDLYKHKQSKLAAKLREKDGRNQLHPGWGYHIKKEYKNYFIGDNDEFMKSVSEEKKKLDKDKLVAQENKRQSQKKSKEDKITRIEKLMLAIINLLEEKAVKMPTSDIDAFLKHQNVDEIKKLCETLYHNGKINRTANYRYFILTEEQQKPKKASAPKSEEDDVEKELEKLKGLLDKGLITQEMYDAKAKELLGL